MLVLELSPRSRGSEYSPPGATSSARRCGKAARRDTPVERLPKLRPTPPPVYDLWKQEELDLLVAATRRMENPLGERLQVLTMIESGARAGELRASNSETSTCTERRSSSPAKAESSG